METCTMMTSFPDDADFAKIMRSTLEKGGFDQAKREKKMNKPRSGFSARLSRLRAPRRPGNGFLCKRNCSGFIPEFRIYSAAEPGALGPSSSLSLTELTLT